MRAIRRPQPRSWATGSPSAAFGDGRSAARSPRAVSGSSSVAADRAAELADPSAEGAAQLGQAFRPEDDQGDDQDDRELEWSDIWHATHGNGTPRDRITANWVGGATRYLGFVGTVEEKCGLSLRFAGSIGQTCRDARPVETKTAAGLHVCPQCGSALVQPTRWEQAGDRGHWRLWRRCPECEWRCDAVHGEARDRRLRRGARPRHQGAERGAEGARAREHAARRRHLHRRPRRGPDHRRRLPLAPGLAVALDDAVGDEVEQPPLLGVEGGGIEPRFAAATISRARERTWSSAPVAAMRSQSASAPAASRARRSVAANRRVRAAARISGRVTVPSSRSVPRALPVRSGGPETSSTSSRSWKARPIAAPKSPSASLVAAQPAGALEQLRGLQPAALEVALLGDSRCRRRPGAGRARRGRAPTEASASSAIERVVAVLGEQREGAREEQVAGGDRAVAAGDGGDRRLAAAQRRGVEDVVVDEGRHVDQLDRGRRPHRLLPPVSARRRAGPAAAAAACPRPRASRPASPPSSSP